MNENQNESKANASMDETDRLEEYREWLAFAQTDYNCARRISIKRHFIPGR